MDLAEPFFFSKLVWCFMLYNVCQTSAYRFSMHKSGINYRPSVKIIKTYMLVACGSHGTLRQGIYPSRTIICFPIITYATDTDTIGIAGNRLPITFFLQFTSLPHMSIRARVVVAVALRYYSFNTTRNSKKSPGRRPAKDPPPGDFIWPNRSNLYVTSCRTGPPGRWSRIPESCP